MGVVWGVFLHDLSKAIELTPPPDMEAVEVEYIELSHIRKEVPYIMRCVITSNLIAITLIMIAYFLYMSVKKGCKLVQQKYLPVNENKIRM